MQTQDYIIRGGIEGRERLRILSRVMQPNTIAFLTRAGARPGMSCWEVGCGGGDVACDLAGMVGPQGKVIATDIDKPQLDIASGEAKARGVTNLEFRFGDVTADEMDEKFDFIHARFILTHLADPVAALKRMRRHLAPGGVVAVEDIDFAGHFCHPPCQAFDRYIELYGMLARSRGADAHIGPRLPSLFAAAGFESVRMNVAQPAGISGEVKLIAAITMENIGPALLKAGLADAAEIDQIVGDLYAYGWTDGTLSSLARVFEVWGG
jgi:ubiquinone/menaquinone biosynthesis C-methylase UbiE